MVFFMRGEKFEVWEFNSACLFAIKNSCLYLLKFLCLSNLQMQLS